MARRRLAAPTLLLLLVLPALGGCIVGNDSTQFRGSSDGSNGALEVGGRGEGTFRTTFLCGFEGALTVEGDINDGTVRIEVRDGDGDVSFARTRSPGDEGLEGNMTGRPGTWTLIAYTSRDFDGRFTTSVDCDGS